MVKKVIYFVRHGETLFNRMKKIQGSSDIELSDIGMEQAKNVKGLEGIFFDKLLHSGLKRSKETLEIIKKSNNLENNIEENDLLKERSYGIFEGLTEIEIESKYSILYDEWKKNENAKIEGSESIDAVIERFLKFCNIVRDNDFKSYLCVTHSGFLYAIYKYITNTHLGIRPKIKFLNCSLSILNINDDKLEFIIGNETYVN